MDNEKTTLGGTITPDQIREFKIRRDKYFNETIQMYFDHYVKELSYEIIGRQYGLTAPGVRYRINKFLGEFSQI